VKDPAALQRYKFDIPLRAAGSLIKCNYHNLNNIQPTELTTRQHTCAALFLWWCGLCPLPASDGPVLRFLSGGGWGMFYGPTSKTGCF
ncbi:hypothetical protein HMPREF1548_05621, partial [Clostridium sp. KLE 1755]|uniref:hypothetical protein n=1 Tax=Clostridium sp. KLE 1755 TaxID=1226325 RepID=UPI0003971C0F